MIESFPPRLVVAAVALVSPALAWAAEPMRLVEPGATSTESMAHLDSTAAVVEHEGEPLVEVQFGHFRPYPNIQFLPVNGDVWDLSAYERVEFDLVNLSDDALKIGGRVDNEGANGQRNHSGGSLTLEPGAAGTLSVEFNRPTNMELRRELLGMHDTPWGSRSPLGATLDASAVTRVQVYLQKPPRDYTIGVREVRAVGVYDPASATAPEPFFPFVDRFGQYMHADWPGKVTSADDFATAREVEAAAMGDQPKADGLDNYGGWADGPQLDATGHFRTEKIDGKWHLVDPDGHLFWSMGLCVVKADGPGTPVSADRATWFADAPWENEPAMKAHLRTGKVNRGDYPKGDIEEFSFYTANLQRKYGEDWHEAWLEVTPKRLMNWGFNTVANWSDDALHEQGGIPYTDWVFINSAKLPWQNGTRNRISDPFDPMLRHELDRRMDNMLEESKDDPWCIGVFVDNELSWGDESYLATGVVEMGEPDEYSKAAMRDWLAEKYGSVTKFNAAWDLRLATFDDFLENKTLPKTEEGKADLVAFNEIIVRKYYETVHDALEEHAPNKLYLGDRLLAYANPQVTRAAAEYCDVVSINLYRDSVGAWKPAADVDTPFMVGEFHFGAGDRGVFGDGLVAAENSEDRAAKFRTYVESALANPLLVGAHWFQAVDEPTTGRTLEGENHGIGFLTVADTPHPEMLEASQAIAAEMYPLRHKKD